MELNAHSPKPLYIQLDEILRDEIESKELKPHDPIPSEKNLVERFGVSRMTVRRALDALVSDGVIYRVQGKGAFVAEPKMDSKALTLIGLSQQLRQLGYETTTQLIKFDIVPATRKIAEALHLNERDEVYEIVRTRSTKDSPIAFDTSYIPVKIVPNLKRSDVAGQSLYQILKDKYDLSPTDGVETLEATAATVEEAALLGTKQGVPLILLRIHMFHNKTPIEYAKVLFRGDKFRLTIKNTP
jgi:GntR family transcriptional regulator